MNIVSCIVARTTSTRLPLKVLRSVNVNRSKSMLDVIISKAKQSKLTNKIVLCTSDEACDDILEDVAFKNEIDIYRGEGDEVICRLLNVAKQENADYIIRITGDNVFASGEYIDEQIDLCIKNDLDYCRLTNVPIGATAEVIKVSALKHLMLTIDPAVSEYLMLYIFDPKVYKCGILSAQADFSNLSITVDTPEDLANVKEVIKLLGDTPEALSLVNICELMSERKDLFGYVPDDAKVKLPYGKSVTYMEFKKTQNLKIKGAQCHKILSTL